MENEKMPTARQIADEMERRSMVWLKEHNGESPPRGVQEMPDAVLLALGASHLRRHLMAAQMFKTLTGEE